MTTWNQLLNQIRLGVLNDSEPDSDGEYRWPETQLTVAFNWALTEFAEHTALAKEIRQPATGGPITLPDDLYDADSFEKTGMVFIEKANGDIAYLDPIRETPNLDFATSSGWWTYPGDVLHLRSREIGNQADTLVIQYFAYYPTVGTKKTDVVPVPRWAEMPLCYLAGAHALSSGSMKSASIRQWLSGDDKGTPEHNPLRAQQQQFFNIYRDSIRNRDPQDRSTYWRKYGKR